MSDKTVVLFVVVVWGWEGVEGVCDFFTSSKGKFPKKINLTFELFPDLINKYQAKVCFCIFSFLQICKMKVSEISHILLTLLG